MFILTNYTRQVFRAHHHSPYVRILLLAVVIHLLLFVFTPPFQVKPYQLAEAKPVMRLTEVPEFDIPALPPDVPLPPREVIPVDDGCDEITLPPNLVDDLTAIPPLTNRDVKKQPKFYPFDEAPILIKFTPPVYPPLAREAGIQGDVKVKVLVGRDGLVKEVSILESNVTKEMERSALAAAKQCRFKPGKQQTKPVPVMVMMPFKFRLGDCE
jgi:protein TonB